MKLTRINISKLFGFLDYDIELGSNEITILTGPNGYGKTMILKIINGILSNELSILCSLKFDKVTLEWLGGGISISHENEPDELIAEHFDRYYSILSKEKIKLERKKPITNKERLMFDSSIYELFHDSLEIKKKEYNDGKLHSSYLNGVLCDGIVSFIVADRLQVIKNNDSVIDSCARKLKRLIKNARNESADLSQRLDATFPMRLFDRLEQNKRFSSANIKERLNGIQSKRHDYMCYGLIHSEDNLMPESIASLNSSNEYLGMLDLYIDDALEKLSPFDSLHQKIYLFESILKDKILAFKEIAIDIEQGFYFKGEGGDIIDRNMLSSGEQNQVVLLFDLVFNLDSQKIILIDEPEISLHVAWQQTFLDSLKKIQDINKYEKVIIATHSPQIISKNWNLTVDLYDIVSDRT